MAADKPAQEPSTRIMVVDDSATVRKFTERLLTRHGMHVETAKDGVDAMEKLEQAAPHVILLDIEMPRMNGFQFAAVMRQKTDFKDTPIIMISSRIAPKHQQVAGSLGVRKFLGKPYQDSHSALLRANFSQLLVVIFCDLGVLCWHRG
ncbi:MAG: response regulator [Gammaproteobacteria bacterium]